MRQTIFMDNVYTMVSNPACNYGGLVDTIFHLSEVNKMSTRNF